MNKAVNPRGLGRTDGGTQPELPQPGWLRYVALFPRPCDRVQSGATDVDYEALAVVILLCDARLIFGGEVRLR